MTIILKDEGREISLPTRTTEILLDVLEVSAEIERAVSGRVTFHFKGRSVATELLKNYQRREAAEKSEFITHTSRSTETA